VGFEPGRLKGALFDDVAPALERWNHHGAVAIYSSGFVAAQQLPFRYPMFGKLTPRAVPHLDTRSAPRTEPASYAAIASNPRLAPREVCSFSDEVREFDTAREAGMEIRLVMRPGNVGVSDSNGHVVIESFDAVG
jgi:enolase-phosphatase E1